VRETIVVRLTGSGVGAIAVILVAGERALQVVEKVTRRGEALRGSVVAGLRSRKSPIGHTRIVNAAGEIVDDAVVVRVGDEQVELHVHGGTAVVAAVIRAVEEAGARQVDLEEAGRLGVLGRGIVGEVMMALPLAKTMTAAKLIAAQVDEGLGRWAREWRRKAATDLWQLHAAAQWVLERSRSLRFLIEGGGPRVAIVGPVNAGKSTLANMLLGRQVAITSAVAGTTRDWVDAETVFVADDMQVAVTLVDTAGVRETADMLECESIKRTHQQANDADVIVLLMDGSCPQTAEDRALLQRYLRSVVAINKSDLLISPSPPLPLSQAISISARTGDGLDALMRTVLARLDLVEIRPDEPFAFTRRQCDILTALSLTENTPQAISLLDAMMAC